MRNNKGFTLIEILIAVLIIAIVFTMFSVIMSTYYRQHMELGYKKTNREDAVSGTEKSLAGNSITSKIGDLKVTLEIPGEADVQYDCDISRKAYNSSKDPSAGSDNKYIYIYTK